MTHLPSPLRPKEKEEKKKKKKKKKKCRVGPSVDVRVGEEGRARWRSVKGLVNSIQLCKEKKKKGEAPRVFVILSFFYKRCQCVAPQLCCTPKICSHLGDFGVSRLTVYM